jgi:hypothetical protein
LFVVVFFFFFLSFNFLIGRHLSTCNCCKPHFSSLYNCQLLCFCPLAVKYCSPGLPTAFFVDIAPSRMFTANSLCLTVCHIHEWGLYFYNF